MTVQTHTHVSPELRLAARQGLVPAKGSGWLAGFANMLAKELGEWFRTRRVLLQLVIWLFFINGMMAYVLFGVEDSTPPQILGLNVYYSVIALAGAIGMIILSQDEIIQEKQSGTAAWILSKPAARQSFILSKLLANLTGALVFIVGLPGLIALGEIYLASHQLVPLLPFLAGAGVVTLVLVFYLSLVILLGVLFPSRGPVMGIALGLLVGGLFITQFFPQLAYVLPVSMDKIALAITQGMPLDKIAISELVVTAALSIAFIPAALWSFRHKEF